MFHSQHEFFYRINHPINRSTKQRGSALVVAIFVIVIMTLIGSALVKMQGSSSEAVVYEVVGTRAYAAAQTGIQWQLTELFPLNTPAVTLCKPIITEPDISNVAGLEHCLFEITCQSNIEHDGVRYYTVTSKGSCDFAGIYTSRSIEVEARSIN